VLFHGRIHAYKGLDILLDALLELQAKNLHYALTIAGAGDLTPYQQKLDALDNVTIQNYFVPASEMLHLLATHDIAVLPYKEASQSGVALDALWAAMPAIATPVGALSKQLQHGVDALMLNNVNAHELAVAVEKLSSDKQLFEALSRGAYNSYQSSGPVKAAMQWNNLYAHISNTWKI
jgi:glycosyltransferase involved in cell wall biosynthesis